MNVSPELDTRFRAAAVREGLVDVRFDVIESPVGELLVAATPRGLCRVSYTVEGVRAKGPIGYLKGLVPAGVTGGMAGFIFGLEVLSNLMRLLSLSIRLFANILAGHLIILFMAGGLAVIGVRSGWAALSHGSSS